MSGGKKTGVFPASGIGAKAWCVWNGPDGKADFAVGASVYVGSTPGPVWDGDWDQCWCWNPGD